MSETRQKINNIVYDVLCNYSYFPSTGITGPDDITAEHRLKDQLGADSLDSIEILMHLEEEFNANFDDTVAEKWQTVGDIYNYFEG